jgi:CBS domain-containing protein
MSDAASEHPGTAPATLPRTRDEDVAGLTVADVMHADVTSMLPTVTVGEMRAWFAGSPSRRLAVIAADGRYAGALTPADVASGARDDQPALDVARDRPTVAPEAPALTGRDLAIGSEARRIPVVDAAGRFRGVLAVTSDLQHFACRPLPPPS